MSTLAEEMAEDRRLIMLRALSEMANGQLNETILKLALGKFGHASSRDRVRTDMSWLEEQGLVRLEKIHTGENEFWVAHLRDDGEDVAAGRRKHPGVARRLG